MRKTLFLLSAAVAFGAMAQRATTDIRQWEFTKGTPDASTKWQSVQIPHDWAIYGPFDINNDLQIVAVEQNGETEKTLKTGRTGGLPFIGKGAYRTNINIADTAGRNHTLVFDGAMSHARVKVNGKELAYWPYGYNSFYVDLDSALVPGDNLIEVDLENYEQASRWYPGAGLYRNVHLVSTDDVHIPVWGTYVTTPIVKPDYAQVRVVAEIQGLAKGQKADVVTDIVNDKGDVVSTKRSLYVYHGQPCEQNLIIDNPELWSLKNPNLYTARTRVIVDGAEVDQYDTRFGVRTLEYIPNKGFYLNGELTKFHGVNNHHDLGPLGAAVNKSALRHQIEMLQDIGVNAIRTSHNMPAPELVELCDEMGIMLMIEPFDDWSFRPKSPNGYGKFFNDWAERDITNMVKQYRNAPSVVMWSSGNEVPSQWGPDGVEELEMLQDVIRSLDPTRPITNGMDQIGAVLDNGFAAAVEIPGFNYKPQYYEQAYEKLPQQMMLGTETASTVSSRGKYHFPVQVLDHQQVTHPDNQSSSYDVEACSWSNIPDLDFASDEDLPYLLGQFVWTGFDYLGEPSPYDTDAWPSHSSYFGIIDLASIPKDRYYLYRSQWNKEEPTLHVLPHWNWPGREGEVTPVFVYTSYPKAEVFINGKSQGVREFNDSTVMNRFRLMWNETVYEPGEVKVVAYNEQNEPVAETVMRTPGKAHHLVATPNRAEVDGNGDELVYFTITVEDKDGNPVPTDERMVKFRVDGAGEFEATANGDPTCLLPFQNPEMKLFSGAATAIARANGNGDMTLTVTAPGLKPAKSVVKVK